MSESLLSGKPGIPTGAGRLLNATDLENAIDDSRGNINVIETNVGSTIHAGTFDDDGSTLAADDQLSCTREAEGIFVVTSTTNYGTDGSGNVLAVPVVTPMGEVASPSAIIESEYLGLTTETLDSDDSGIFHDPIRGRVWATDHDHGPVVGTDADRIGILELSTQLWEYITVNDGGWNSIFLQKGCTFFPDFTNRLVYVQVANNAGDRSTNIYDMNSGYTLLMQTFDDITHAQANYAIVMAVDPTNNKALMMGDTTLAINTTTDGIPATGSLGSTVTGSPPDVSHLPIVTTDGHFWYVNVGSGGSWADIDGGAASHNDRGGGASGVNLDRLNAYNPVDGHIYFLDNAQDRLKKINTQSPYTVTILTPSDYPALTAPNRATTARGIDWLGWNADYTKLIAVRGSVSGATTNDFLLIDPADGSIDFQFALRADLAYQYTDPYAGQDVGRIWMLGTKRILEIIYGNAETVAELVYNPVIPAARMTSGTTCQVEFFDAYVHRKRVNSAFHIHIKPIT